MPGSARSDIVRDGEVAIYHAWSRCVQRAFLCGDDPLTGIDFSYRRECVEKLIEFLASVCAIDVGNYSILSNHFHIIPRTRPDIAQLWSNEELAYRYQQSWPRWDAEKKEWSRVVYDEDIRRLAQNAPKITEIRDKISTLSHFMARLKEPLAKLFNAESKTSGHFWEARFSCRELESSGAVATAMFYNDLNQLKARLSDTFEDADHSAIQRRIIAARQRQAQSSLAVMDREKTEYTVGVTELTRLLADSHLSPIAETGPLMTGYVPELPTTSVRHSSSASPSTDSPSTPSASTEARSTGRRVGRPPRQRTTRFHQRFQERRRQRLTDNVFMPCPWDDYFRLADWLRLKFVNELDSSQKKQGPIPPLTRETRWRSHFQKFLSWVREQLQGSKRDEESEFASQSNQEVPPKPSFADELLLDSRPPPSTTGIPKT